MPDYAIMWEWLSFAVRWTHVITAIAWIGSSFYFIALDLGLRKTPSLPPLAHGEEWQVHGGGFYHIQKYLVAPEFLPEHLTWFKWESYATWLSGFAMLAIVYYAGADLFLIDRNVLDVSAPVAIGISLASLALGWILYDLLCKSPLSNNDTLLMLVLYAIVVFMAWGYTQLFTGRAAFLHLGAFTATIMSANVFMVIIPMGRKAFDVQLPDPTVEPQKNPPKVSQIVLEVLPGEQYAINKTAVSKNELFNEFKKIYDPRPEKILFIKGDPEVKYQDVIFGMDQARGAGVKVIGTTPRTAPGAAKQ